MVGRGEPLFFLVVFEERKIGDPDKPKGAVFDEAKLMPQFAPQSAGSGPGGIDIFVGDKKAEIAVFEEGESAESLSAGQVASGLGWAFGSLKRGDF